MITLRNKQICQPGNVEDAFIYDKLQSLWRILYLRRKKEKKLYLISPL